MGVGPELSDADYGFIFSRVPRLCVDAIVRDVGDKFILLRRTGAMRTGRLWVPGGRVQFGESLEAAMRRKLLTEIGIDYQGTLTLVGVFEDVAEHSVSAVFELDGAIPIESVTIDTDHSAVELSDSLPPDFTYSRLRQTRGRD